MTKKNFSSPRLRNYLACAREKEGGGGDLIEYAQLWPESNGGEKERDRGIQCV